MMHQGELLSGGLLMGGILGLFYFGGLWYTLSCLPRTRRPILLFGWSYLIRLGTVLGIFHLLLQWTPRAQLPLLIFSFIGFLWARTWLLMHLSLRLNSHRKGKTL